MLKHKENINKLVGLAEELPDEKFSQLFNYAMFLMFEEKELITEQMFFHYSVSNISKRNNETETIDIPVFSCNGMKQAFNRADLYGTRF